MKLVALPLILAMTGFVLAADTPQKRTDRFMKQAIEQIHAPGAAYAVVLDGKVVQRGAVGLANIEHSVKTTVQTRFLLASITKQFTAAGIMRLRDQGKLDVDAKISTYLTDAPDAWSEITVRELLGHTAGLTDRWEEADTKQWKLYYPKDQMYVSSKAKSLQSRPGEHWSYSDQGYFLLGMIIEKLSGKTYRQFLTDEFFTPLGMTSSTTDNLDEIVPNLANGYTQVNKKWFHNNRRTVYGMTSHYGVVSTIDDLAKWAIALQAGKVVSDASRAMMWTPTRLANGTVAPVAQWDYGFGWFLQDFAGHQIVQHGGSTGTALYMLPEAKLTVIVLTNLEQLAGGDAPGLAAEIAKIYAPQLSWGAQKPATDPDPAFTKALAEEFGRFGQGAMDLSLYEPAYGKMIQPTMPSQKAFFSQTGPVKSIDYLFGRPGEALGYRVVFEKQGPFYATLRRNGEGKIIFFTLTGEELP